MYSGHMNSLLFRVLVFLAVLVVLLIVGILGFMVAEGLSFLDALYFTVVTISTVGYGDIHPVTIGGKILAFILIVVGVGTFLGFFASATQLLLQRREDKARKMRLNTVIGLFFSEIGTHLLRMFSSYDPDLENIRKQCCMEERWSDTDFDKLHKHLKSYRFEIDTKKIELQGIYNFLKTKGELLVHLLENPNLVEHESFTELLRALFHLRDELFARGDLFSLPDTDIEHLTNDARRVYIMLGEQWIIHMRYLKQNYPYLFSLALRTNPFNVNASPIVTE
jgi:voltage-gated potassium channel